MDRPDDEVELQLIELLKDDARLCVPRLIPADPRPAR
jgi:hypothetical protein